MKLLYSKFYRQLQELQMEAYMNSIEVKNIFTALSAAIPDPAVGISLAHLLGDELFSYYVTEVPPQYHLAAHFHREGHELYQVIEGKGEIWLADVKKNKLDTQTTQHKVLAGDTFLVPALTAHQLVNSGPDPLIMLFGCPQSHITSDRKLLENLKFEINGEQ